MNYHRIHNEIIDRALNRIEPLEHVEQHHIIPISLGGEDCRSNIARLTPREHFLIHKILIRLNSGIARRKMINAFCYMAFTRNNKCLRRRVKARDYEYARKICKDGMYTKERNEKISKSRLAKIASGWRQERTDETKTKHRRTLAQKKTNGIGISDHHKAAISKGLIGNKNGIGNILNDEHKGKISDANAKTYQVEDPSGKIFDVKNLSVWLESMNCRTRMFNQKFKKGPLKDFTIFRP